MAMQRCPAGSQRAALAGRPARRLSYEDIKDHLTCLSLQANAMAIYFYIYIRFFFSKQRVNFCTTECGVVAAKGDARLK